MAKDPIVAQMLSNEATPKAPRISKESTWYLDDLLGNYRSEELPKLELSAFRDIWLPGLLASWGDSKVNQHQVRVAWEQKVARNIRNHVLIVDDHDPEVVRYVVPPLMGSIETETITTGATLTNLVIEGELVRNRLERKGQAMIDQLIDETKISSDTKIWSKQWAIILLDFGYIEKDADGHFKFTNKLTGETPDSVTVLRDPANGDKKVEGANGITTSSTEDEEYE